MLVKLLTISSLLKMLILFLFYNNNNNNNNNKYIYIYKGENFSTFLLSDKML